MKLFSKIKLSKYIKKSNFNISNKWRNIQAFDVKRKFSSYFINNMGNTNYLKGASMTILGMSGLALGYYLLNGPSNQASCVESTNNKPARSASERINNEATAETALEAAIYYFKEKKYKLAMIELLNAAKYGNNLAQYQLGIHLLDGKYVHPEPDQALYWLNRSLFRTGDNLTLSMEDDDEEEPIDDYPEDVKAMLYIGLIHEAGLGKVKKDPIEALYWFAQAMDEGDERSVNEMGVIIDKHTEDKTNPEDMIEAYENYYNAQERGERFAAYNMGKMSMMDIGSLQRNYKHAYKYFKEASKKGLTPALIEMSILLNRGLGVAKNNNLAEKQLVKAIMKGNVLAIYNLAFAYETGAFGVKDEVKALGLYREAYERGDIPSLYKLAVMSIQGRGCTADFSKGVRFLRIAASKGDESAKKYLNTLIEERTI